MTAKSIVQKLYVVQMLLDNIQENDEVRALLDAAGCSVEHLAEGRIHYEKVEMLQQQLQSHYDEQRTATATFYRNWRLAHRIYSRHVKVARAVFKAQPAATIALQLAGPRQQAFAGWLAQAEAFYSQLLASPAYCKEMTLAGLSSAALEEGHELVREVFIGKLQQRQLNSAAGQLKQTRDAALHTMLEWFGTFRAVAQYALMMHPNLLHTLNFSEVAPLSYQ